MAAADPPQQQASLDLVSEDEIRELRAALPKFWPLLTRVMNSANAAHFAEDPKLPQTLQQKHVIWLPPTLSSSELEEQKMHYSETMDVRILPRDRALWKSYVREPGILALAWSHGKPVPYVVPGGRFNEFYGWDSYFIALGLLNDGLIDLAEAVIVHFAFEIDNYGCILNANRPCFLTRTQPPFVTSLALELNKRGRHGAFVRGITAAIKEYREVWVAAPRFDIDTGLSYYRPTGDGIPPEVEPGHFDDVLAPYARERSMSIAHYAETYELGRDPELDRYLANDRAVRESGHDVSTRLAGRASECLTIDLACLLYKYESDIASAIKLYPESFPSENSEEWAKRASKRKSTVTKIMWNPRKGLFEEPGFGERDLVITPTQLWALWANLATPEQADQLVSVVLPLIECSGGLASSERLPGGGGWQWDWPAGWAPHQIMAWQGLLNYGYIDDAKRLAKKWLLLVVSVWKETGAVYEKYDVVAKSARISAEYGNQGSNTTGFGWTNASISIAMDVLRL